MRGTIEGLHQFKGYTYPTEVAFAVATSRMPGIDHCIGRRQFRGRVMVVSDDDIDAQLVGVRDLFNIGTGAVGGDNQRCATRFEHVNGSEIESAAIVNATGDVEVKDGLGVLERAEG